MPHAFNSVLPDDITVTDAAIVDDSFHVRHNVIFKEYIYVINNSVFRDPFTQGRAYHYPKHLNYDDIEKMNKAAQLIIGNHDFACFMSSGSGIEDTVRNVKYLNVTKDDDVITIRIAADGFLYNMVRILAGTLLAVGQGKLEPSDIERITEKKDRSLAGSTMPACGLYLNRVVY
jgi:tRNA pseudouridine38-40 synthase